MPIRFRIRWIPLLATLIVAAIGVSLGQWQTRRGDEKQAIQAKMAARQSAPAMTLENAAGIAVAEAEFRHVKLRGRFVPAWVTYLENRPYNGVPGFYVLMPFKIAGSAESAILIERGWTPRDANDRTRVPTVPTPADEVEIEGVIRSDAGHLLQLGTAEAPRPGAIMQNLDIAAYARASQLPLAPFVVEQSGEIKDGLVRDWPAPSLGIDRHRGYAVQWYALALMAVIFFVVTGFRSGKKQRAE
ncbi:SURF1 family protein [Herbaspirillum lusitanum]|uniref:SURF1 family protein n=1 Tax=Herbaspirillum lusitanum TaxID=213312 RepID=UPI0022387A9D|nr:SURF1 family protein [Herbaspirillum lusitanum]MCW5297369.1 SURF1 family protein [Herbaspirillum lusitanum]